MLSILTAAETEMYENGKTEAGSAPKPTEHVGTSVNFTEE